MEITSRELTFHKRKWSWADKYNRPGQYITSDEGKTLQQAMWTEVIDVLEEKIPRVKDVIASLSEACFVICILSYCYSKYYSISISD
jgi:hypothetical protein